MSRWIVVFSCHFLIGLVIALLCLYTFCIVFPLVYGGAVLTKIGWYLGWGQWPEIVATDRIGQEKL